MNHPHVTHFQNMVIKIEYEPSTFNIKVTSFQLDFNFLPHVSFYSIMLAVAVILSELIEDSDLIPKLLNSTSKVLVIILLCCS